MSRAFSRLHPSLVEALNEKGWKATPVQEHVVPELMRGHDRVIIAPTGSGKTMAGILPLFHRCLEEAWPSLSILYITPLRALNRDVDRRLRELAASVGLRVDVRHGDTSQAQRTKQTRRPPNLLVTTPETFQLMFSGKNLRAMLSTVQAVVVDEVHDLAASERGWQLSVALSRLEALAGRSVQRLGLSATVGNPEAVAKWLSPSGRPLITTGDRTTSLTVESPVPLPEDEVGCMDLGLNAPRQHAVYRQLCNILRTEAPCLVFVNSRSEAETLATHLQALAPDLNIGVHHGSLAADTRQSMEDELREGRLAGLVCTSSLELGIDVGSVRRIVQLHSPKSVDRMLQRVGRADHRLGGVGRGHVLTWDVDHLMESAVIAKRAMDGAIEPVEWRSRPQNIAANQLVLMVHCFKAVSIDEATKLLAASPQFEGWERTDTEALLHVLAENWVLRFTPVPSELPWYRWPKAVYAVARQQASQKGIELPEDLPLYSTPDEAIPRIYTEQQVDVPKQFANGWFSSAGRTREWVSHHLSMIPDKRTYRVRDAVTRRSLGNVDEAFVLSLNASGEDDDGTPRRFVIAGRTWVIVDADPEQSELLVAPVKDHGKAPRWIGELPPVPASVAREVGYLRHLVAADLGMLPAVTLPDLDPLGLVPARLGPLSQYPLDDEARSMLAETVTAHLDATGHLPTDQVMTVEERDDALVVNSCHGSTINEALGNFLLAMASTKSGTWGRLVVEPTRISLQISGVRPEELVNWLMETPPDAIEQLLSITVPNSRQVRWRFAQVAKVFGVLRHGVDPRKINLQALLRRYRGTVVMEEVLSKLFHERMDVNGATDVLRGLQSGVLAIHITARGPLGLSNRTQNDMLLPNWDNAALREQLKLRLTNERAVLCCLRCQAIRRFRVAKYVTIDRPGTCLKCGGQRLACAREGLQEMLEKWVASEDRKDQDRMMKIADLVANRGIEAIMCLMGRGIAEATANRLLVKVRMGDEEGLLQAIHHAEVEYARTRRFWG
ncbi:MAG: DEAD/DEAH box helicase [Candidatus Poseidonia sp.]|nr:DEAD/DEAH box helicase [Poseidonia sp.]